jgi:hypothetical protein
MIKSVDPSTLSSALMPIWVKADAGITLSVNQVTTWADQSGNGNALTSPSSGARPTFLLSEQNGLPCIEFAAGSDYTQSAITTAFDFLHNGTSPYSVIWLGKKNTTAVTTNYPIVSTARSTGEIGASVVNTAVALGNTNVRLTIIRGTAGTAVASFDSKFPAGRDLLSYNIFCCQFSSLTELWWWWKKNKVNSGSVLNTPLSAATSSAQRLRVCGLGGAAVSETGGWTLGELLIVKTTDEATIQGIITYLRLKWDIKM